MNTAAPVKPTYNQVPIRTAGNAPQILKDTHRMAAHDAIKDACMNGLDHNNRRRKSSEMEGRPTTMRIDRHLANRAYTVRESSSKYASDVHESERDALAKIRQARDIHERRRSIDRARIPTFDTTTRYDVAASRANTISYPSKSAQRYYPSHPEQQHPLQHIYQPPPPPPLQQQEYSYSQQPDQPAHSSATHPSYPQPHPPPSSHHQQQQQQPPLPPPPSTMEPIADATAPAHTSAPATGPSRSGAELTPTPSVSGRQSRLSSTPSSKETYKRKYGELPGYSYIGTIGQGNFGKVLLAEHDMTGEQVAVKILEKAQFKSEQQRLHATREARLMATLRHPYIVDVKTVLEDDARILIVMEHLTGGELFDYISNKGVLDEKEARRIFHQIVLALNYCHENNVVHRDLKPENILLDSEKNVRVADFGFGNHWHKDRHLTTYCGSPFYAAPEMVSGTPYIGPETDVWSLGVILYVLVCGRLPFDANDLPQLFAQIKRGNYQKPREGSMDVCSLIHRMLTVDPKRRATLTDVLRSRWMRNAEELVAPGAGGLGLNLGFGNGPTVAVTTTVTTTTTTTTATATANPAVQQQQQQEQPRSSVVASTTAAAATTPTAVPILCPEPQRRSVANSNYQNQRYQAQTSIQQQPQTQSVTLAAALNTHHPNMDISHTMPLPPPPIATGRDYHHYHSQQPPPLTQQQQQQQQAIVYVQDLKDDAMSDASPSGASSPTETLATISPSTAGPSPTDMCYPVVVSFHDPVVATTVQPVKKHEPPPSPVSPTGPVVVTQHQPYYQHHQLQPPALLSPSSFSSSASSSSSSSTSSASSSSSSSSSTPTSCAVASDPVQQQAPAFQPSPKIQLRETVKGGPPTTPRHYHRYSVPAAATPTTATAMATATMIPCSSSSPSSPASSPPRGGTQQSQSQSQSHPPALAFTLAAGALATATAATLSSTIMRSTTNSTASILRMRAPTDDIAIRISPSSEDALLLDPESVIAAAAAAGGFSAGGSGDASGGNGSTGSAVGSGGRGSGGSCGGGSGSGSGGAVMMMMDADSPSCEKKRRTHLSKLRHFFKLDRREQHVR